MDTQESPSLPMADMQRVSPLALLYFFARTVISLARQLMNFIPLLVIVLATNADLRGLIIMGVATLVPIALVGFTLLDWWCFRYAISPTRLEVRQGVIRRKQLSLEFARVQQADVREPWYFRPFGLAILGVESAGSEGQEVELAGLATAAAYAHKDIVLRESTPLAEVEADSPEQTVGSQARTLFKLPSWEVARYGLMHNPILLLLPVLVYPLSQADRLDDFILPYLEAALASVEQYQQMEYLWVGIVFLTVMVLLALVAVSMVIALVRFYGYRLEVHDHRYHAHMGLINKTSRSFQYVRLQRVTISQGPIARLLRRVSVRINQTGQNKTQHTDNVFFIPILNAEREQLLRQEIALETPVWRRVHWASTIVPWCLTTALITLIIALISQFSPVAIVHSLWISALCAAIVQGLSWRQRGLFVGQHWFATRHGVLGQQQRFIPSGKVQAVKLTQSPWLRTWGMARLTVYSAAGRETLAWLPYSQLKALQQDLLQRTKEFKGRWM